MEYLPLPSEIWSYLSRTLILQVPTIAQLGSTTIMELVQHVTQLVKTALDPQAHNVSLAKWDIISLEMNVYNVHRIAPSAQVQMKANVSCVINGTHLTLMVLATLLESVKVLHM
jgi:hypothetical protein